MTESEFTGVQKPKAWCWSKDGENYHSLEGATELLAKAEAIEEARGSGCSKIYFAVRSEADVYYPAAGYLIDDIREMTQDETGDWSDCFLDEITSEMESDFEANFQAMVGAWLTRHKLWPTWHGVEDPIEIDLDVKTDAKESAAPTAP